MTTRLKILLQAVSVRRGSIPVLRQIAWTLRPGERWALIGNNGSGKTQLLKLLCGDVWPTPATRAKLTYWRGRRLVDLVEARQHIAYVGAERQDKYARYDWNLTVGDVLATGIHRSELRLLPVTSKERKRIKATLRVCGLTRLAERGFLSLSYGEKRLVLLARALVQDPDWLLLDEFYNGLDANYRQRIDTILQAASRKGQSWIVAAHRQVDVPLATQRLIELDQGRVRSMGRLQRADLVRLTASACETPQPTLQLASRSVAPRPLLLRLVNVNLYVEYRLVLRNLNWYIRGGEHCAVLGANGTGKSSFIKLLYGDLSPAWGGRIERCGFPPGSSIIDEWKHQVGYVSPELQTDYALNVNVLELVASGRYASIGLAGTLSALDRRHAIRWLRFFKLLSFAKRRPQELSYGQMRRALMARALAANPRILLLDEPLTGLDPRQRAAMKHMLEKLMRKLTLIMAVHHVEDLPRGIVQVLRLHKRHASLYSQTMSNF